MGQVEQLNKQQKNDLFYNFYTLSHISRNRDKKEIIASFKNIYDIDNDLSIKLLLYIGNKEFLGEKRIVELCLIWIAHNDKEHLIPYLEKFIDIVSWTSIFKLINTPIKQDILQLIKRIIEDDLNKDTNNVSSIAHFLPNINSKNKYNRNIAKEIAKFMKWDYKTYRNKIGLLKEKSCLLKKIFSSKQWTNIDYDKVSIKDLHKYRNVFLQYDEEKYLKYLDKIQGKSTNNSFLSSITKDFNVTYEVDCFGELKIAMNNSETLMKTYNDFIKTLPTNIIPILDTSIDMFSNIDNTNIKPIELALALCIGFAKQFKGYFRDKMLLFKENPIWLNLDENRPLYDVVETLESTIDILSIKNVYNVILKELLSNKEINKNFTILIISTNSFDNSTYNSYQQNEIYNNAREEYQQNGFNIPNIIFWNVMSQKCNFKQLTNRKGITYANGFSDETFQNIIQSTQTIQQDLIDVI